MTDDQSSSPARAFISYSWSTPTHESWVLNLASRLVEDGVDVILDKWDLKPGHDANAFMESMVTDTTVKKVIMVCDKSYVEKADSRSGGVGTESQIISPELYKSSTQDKFAAAITEQDEGGQAYVPVFYRSRIFFDFRSADKFEEAYEQLLRWIVGRPQHVRPKLGSIPEAILGAAPVAVGTQSRSRRADEAIRSAAPGAHAFVREFGDALVAELQGLTPILTEDLPQDEAILTSFAAMRPYLRQLAELVTVALRFSDDKRVLEAILRIHEQLGALMYRSPSQTSYYTQQFDAFKIAAHDAFLTTMALALDEERFDFAAAALARPYLVREHDGGNRRSTSDFTVFRQHPASLEHRNTRLKLNRISLQADLLKEAHPDGSMPSFEAIMQADLVLYLRGEGQPTFYNWYPLTLAYALRRYSAFPLFARAESKAYLSRLAPLLGVDSPEAVKRRIAEANSTERSSRMFDYHGLPVAYLANAEHLGVLD
ncbi:MAG TPA: toll/interleukin-1 receptor domain-containing protein [Allosphingosinicella sp.]